MATTTSTCSDRHAVITGPAIGDQLQAPDGADAVVSYFDARMGANLVKVVIGQHAVSRGDDRILVTTLGSCVAACVRDPVALVGGMNHFLLPDLPEGREERSGGATRYGRAAMDTLIADIVRHGGSRDRLEIKVFGGARVIASRYDIGALNADFILSYIRREGLTLVGQDLGGSLARRVFYCPATGRVMRRVVRPEAFSDTIAQELNFLSAYQSAGYGRAGAAMFGFERNEE